MTVVYIFLKKIVSGNIKHRKQILNFDERLESIGQMELTMKLYLCLPNYSELQIYFLSLPWKIVFSVIAGNYLYL